MTGQIDAMLPAWKVLQVKQLLATGQYSQRQIARRLGISRSTVNQIAKAVRSGEGGVGTDERPYERCPGCGGLVQMPCKACLVRWLAARSALPTEAEASVQTHQIPPLGVNLRPEHYRRYLEVKRRKLTAAEQTEQVPLNDRLQACFFIAGFEPLYEED